MNQQATGGSNSQPIVLLFGSISCPANFLALATVPLVARSLGAKQYLPSTRVLATQLNSWHSNLRFPNPHLRLPGEGVVGHFEN